MWPEFKTEHPIVHPTATEGDVRLASIAFGWTLGFSYFTIWRATKQTMRASKFNTYLLLCWLEVLACAIFAIICWLYLCGFIGYSFWFYMSILTCWALQVQFLLQIIVNRICVLLSSRRDRVKLKAGVAIFITLINITVYCIWIPAKLQISKRYHDINIWWDRIEKCLYLLVDGCLNYAFIRTVKSRLVQAGLKKYDKLVRFNTYIIWVSLSMDVLIITTMSYKNDFVYMQFHPVAYMVKLEIEMAMSDLIVKVARSTGVQIYEGDPSTSSGMRSASGNHPHSMIASRGVEIRVATQTITKGDDYEEHEMVEPQGWDAKGASTSEVSSIGDRDQKVDLEKGFSSAASIQDVEEGVNQDRRPAIRFSQPYPHTP